MSQSYLNYSKKVSNITNTSNESFKNKKPYKNELNNKKPVQNELNIKSIENKLNTKPIENEMDDYLNEIYFKKSIELNDKYYLKDMVTRKIEVDNWNSTLALNWYSFFFDPLRIIYILPSKNENH